MRQIAYKTFGDIYGFDPAFMDTSYPMQPQWIEDEKNLSLELVIPGAEKEDITVERVNDKLVVAFKGNKHSNPFSYEYSASKSILKGKRTAKYEKGVLTITIKKAEDYKETTKVE